MDYIPSDPRPNLFSMDLLKTRFVESGWTVDRYYWGRPIFHVAKTSWHDAPDLVIPGNPPKKGDTISVSVYLKCSIPSIITCYLYNDDTTKVNCAKHSIIDGVTNGVSSDGYSQIHVGTNGEIHNITWVYEEDANKSPAIIVTRLAECINGTVVEVSDVMITTSVVPRAWAPAKGESIPV